MNSLRFSERVRYTGQNYGLTEKECLVFPNYSGSINIRHYWWVVKNNYE